MSNSRTTGPRGAGYVAAGSAAFARCGGYEEKLWLLLVLVTALASRRNSSLVFLQHLSHTGVDVYPTDTSQ